MFLGTVRGAFKYYKFLQGCLGSLGTRSRISCLVSLLHPATSGCVSHWWITTCWAWDDLNDLPGQLNSSMLELDDLKAVSNPNYMVLCEGLGSCMLQLSCELWLERRYAQAERWPSLLQEGGQLYFSCTLVYMELLRSWPGDCCSQKSSFPITWRITWMWAVVSILFIRCFIVISSKALKTACFYLAAWKNVISVKPSGEL